MLDAINVGDRDDREVRPHARWGPAPSRCPTPTTKSYFLDTFGRPFRVLACECERSADPNLSQALNLMNGDVVNRKIADPDGRLARWMKDPKLTDETLVESLYLVTFNRPATPDEVAAATALIAEAPSRTIGAQDLFWGLLNSKEFIFNH